MVLRRGSSLIPVLLLCACPSPPPAVDSGTPHIEFLELPETISADDDEDDNTPGLQFRVRVSLVDGDPTGCTQLEITNATSGDHGRKTVDENGEVDIVLDFVTAPSPGAANEVEAKCTSGDGVASVTGDVFAIDEDGGAARARCVIEEPSDDGDVGGTAQVAVRCTGEGDLSEAQRALVTTGNALVVSEPNGFTAQVQLTGDAATADVDGVGTGTLAFATAGRHELTVTLVDSDGLLVAESDTIAVEVTLSSCDITAPAAGDTLDASDDLDDNPLNGVSTRLQATCPAAGTYTVTCDDEGDQQIVTGAFDDVLDALIPDLVNPDCTARVHVDGLPDAIRSFTVDSASPVIDVVIDPDVDGDGFYEGEDDADNTSAGTLELDVSITPTLASGAFSGSLSVTDDLGAVVFGPVAVALADGSETNVTVSLPVADDAFFTVSVVGTLDGCAAPAPCDTAAFSDRARVDTAAPSGAITVPADGSTLDASADEDANADGMQLSLIVRESAPATNEHTCALSVDGAPASCTAVGATCATTITVPDGAHTVSGTCADEAGNTLTLAPISFTSDLTP